MRAVGAASDEASHAFSVAFFLLSILLSLMVASYFNSRRR